MVEDTCIRLEVALACRGDTISGTVEDHTGDAVEFCGWLELMSAFERVCSRCAQPSMRPDTHGLT